MTAKRGVYGPDDVAWEVQDARDVESEKIYRANKEEIDARERLAIKRDLLIRKLEDTAVYQDGNNGLYLGYERCGNIYVYARIDLDRQLVKFLPLEAANAWLSKWASLSQVGDVCSWNMIAPKGCV